MAPANPLILLVERIWSEYYSIEVNVLNTIHASFISDLLRDGRKKYSDVQAYHIYSNEYETRDSFIRYLRNAIAPCLVLPSLPYSPPGSPNHL